MSIAYTRASDDYYLYGSYVSCSRVDFGVDFDRLRWSATAVVRIPAVSNATATVVIDELEVALSLVTVNFLQTRVSVCVCGNFFFFGSSAVRKNRMPKETEQSVGNRLKYNNTKQLTKWNREKLIVYSDG